MAEKIITNQCDRSLVSEGNPSWRDEPLAVEGRSRGVLKCTEGIEGLKLVRGQLLTRTNHEPPAHFQTLEKGYPEDGTITVIADTDTHLEGWSGAQKGD